ncbi:DUF6351 family protein [soil metagenome]
MAHSTSRRAYNVFVAGVAGATLAACGGGGDDAPSVAPTATVLSSQPGYVSGGEALIGVSGTTTALRLKLNGADVATTFARDPADSTRVIGLVSGLKVGVNTLTIDAGGPASTLTLTSWPITGPMLSGPQITPFICQTDVFMLPDGSRLGAPLDASCSATTRVNYVYRSTAGGALLPMPSTTALPTDVASATNSLGVTVPFVVRVETGTLNRGIYQNAVLHDPTRDPAPTPLTPPAGWNRRLVGVHGTGCTGGWYIQGAAQGIDILAGATLNPALPNVLSRLAEGYAMFTSTLNHPTTSCNITVAGESAMMGKERFIETFGVPFYTVSEGASGGAYTSLQVADAFPGVFDGVLIGATYPDAMSIATSALDAKLLSKYLYVNNTAAYTQEQMVAVAGNKNARAWYDLAAQSGRTDPIPGRVDPLPASPLLGGYRSGVFNAAVPPGLRYDPVNNPRGARPTVFDVNRNVLGIDPATGFALRPFDNVGVQYGLSALNAGTITPTQFIDLNEQVGGYDVDGNYTATRSVGNPDAIERAYQSGLQLGGGGGLASIPVFDTSVIYDEDQIYHYQWFHFAARERMRLSNGDSQNHVMWRGGAPITETSPALGGTTPAGLALSQAMANRSWAAFIKWMEAYKSDKSSDTQRVKVIRGKPAEAVDGCFSKDPSPAFIAEAQTLSNQPNSQCNTLWPSWTATRIEAGGPVASDKLKCQLKPLDAADYKVAFTAAESTRLNTVFAQGVCDWSKPGVSQTAVVPYASFGPSTANLVFDVTK